MIPNEAVKQRYLDKFEQFCRSWVLFSVTCNRKEMPKLSKKFLVFFHLQQVWTSFDKFEQVSNVFFSLRICHFHSVMLARKRIQDNRHLEDEVSYVKIENVLKLKNRETFVLFLCEGRKRKSWNKDCEKLRMMCFVAKNCENLRMICFGLVLA